MFLIIWGVTEEWWQTAVQTQCLCSRLLSSSARNADMHFFLPPPFFPSSLFLSFFLSFSTPPLSVSLFFVDVSTQLQLDVLRIDDKNSFSSLSHTTNSKFSSANHKVYKRLAVLDSRVLLLSSSVHFMALWRLSWRPNGPTSETSWCLFLTKSPAGKTLWARVL